MGRRIRILAIACLGAPFAVLGAALLALWWVSPGTTAPIRDASGDTVPGSVAEIVHPTLGGVPQFVLIRARDTTHPVLLLLHGGPGDPQAPLFQHYNASLEDHFIIVNWDQRGAGRSYSDAIPPETMTVEQLVADTHELTLYLKKRFQRRKILLAGHSWGSYLGMRVVDRFPDDYWAYVGIGQVANQQESEAIGYQSVLTRARAAGNTKAVAELEAVGPPERGRYRGGLGGFGTERKWLREFGGAALGKNNLQALWIFAGPLLSFREYRLQDKFAYLRGEQFSMEHLEEPMLDDDLTKSVPELHVPVFILQGRHDLQTVFESTRAYYEQLRAPHKELVVFENSAHLVPYEEPEKFLRVLVERVRPLALRIGQDTGF